MQRKYFMLGGKGGVGKTTAAASLGIALGMAAPSGAALIVSTDPAHSLSDALDQDVTSGRPIEVAGGRAAARRVFPIYHIVCFLCLCFWLGSPGVWWCGGRELTARSMHAWACSLLQGWPMVLTQVDGTDGKVYALELDLELAKEELRALSGKDEGQAIDRVLSSVGLGAVASQLQDLRLGEHNHEALQMPLMHPDAGH